MALSARGTMTVDFTQDTAHTVSPEERAGFVDYINSLLQEDPDLREQKLVPLNPASDQIYTAVESGLLLAKLVNSVAPNAVDMKKINKKSNLSTFNKSANINVVLAAAREIGVQITNVGAEDIMAGRVLRVGLETQMKRNIEALGLSGYKNLRSAQEILLKWVNDTILAAGSSRTARNLSGDITDSEIYAYLLKGIDASVDPTVILAHSDRTARAEAVLAAAERLGLRRFVQPADIVSGTHRLNFAFVANLFNNAKHAKPRELETSEAPAQPSREAELLAIIDRLQKENEALKRDNDRLKEGHQEGSLLRKRVGELEANAQSSSDASELEHLRQKLAEAEQERARLAEQSASSLSAGQLAQELQSKLAAQEEANRALQAELNEKEERHRKLKEDEQAELARLKSELSAQEEKLKAQVKEKEEEMNRLRSQMGKTEAASSEQQELEGKDFEDRLKAISPEDFVQKKALEEKQDNLMNLPLSAIRNGKEKHSGWLHKAGNKNKSQWKKRYCVLRDNYLFYYHTDNDKKERQGKWVRLNGAKVEVVGDREKDKKRNLFVIHPHHDTPQQQPADKKKDKTAVPQYYEFFGSEEQEMHTWVNQINAQIASTDASNPQEVGRRATLFRTQTIRGQKPPEGLAELVPIVAAPVATAPAALAPAPAAVAPPAAVSSVSTSEMKEEKEKEIVVEDKKDKKKEKKEKKDKDDSSKSKDKKEKKAKKDDSSDSKDKKEKKKDKKEKKDKDDSSSKEKKDKKKEKKEKDEKKEASTEQKEVKVEEEQKKDVEVVAAPPAAVSSVSTSEQKEEKKEGSGEQKDEKKLSKEEKEAHDKAEKEAKKKEKEERDAKEKAKKKEKEEKEAKEKADKKAKKDQEKRDHDAKKEQEKRDHDAKKEAERKEHEEKKQKEKEEKERQKAAEAKEKEDKKLTRAQSRRSDGKGDAPLGSPAAPIGSPAAPKEEEKKLEIPLAEMKEEEKPKDGGEPSQPVTDVQTA